MITGIVVGFVIGGRVGTIYNRVVGNEPYTLTDFISVIISIGIGTCIGAVTLPLIIHNLP